LTGILVCFRMRNAFEIDRNWGLRSRTAFVVGFPFLSDHSSVSAMRAGGRIAQDDGIERLVSGPGWTDHSLKHDGVGLPARSIGTGSTARSRPPTRELPAWVETRFMLGCYCSSIFTGLSDGGCAALSHDRVSSLFTAKSFFPGHPSRMSART